jgi:hypothetical protein
MISVAPTVRLFTEALAVTPWRCTGEHGHQLVYVRLEQSVCRPALLCWYHTLLRAVTDQGKNLSKDGEFYQ